MHPVFTQIYFVHLDDLTAWELYINMTDTKKLLDLFVPEALRNANTAQEKKKKTWSTAYQALDCGFCEILHPAGSINLYSNN